MPRANEIAVIVKLRDKFSAEIAKVRSGMKGLQSEWQGYMKVGAAAAVVSGAMAAGLMKCVQGAGKAAFAEERLQTLLNNVVKERDKNIKSLVDQAEAYEQLLGVEAEQTITVQAMLASFQLTKQQIMEATPRVLDIAAAVARASGEAANYQTVAIGLGKALNGNVGVLSKMGIVLSEETLKTKDFNAVLKDIDLNARGAAKALGETLAAESAKLGHAFGMITDAIGAELIPVLRSLLKTVTPIVRKFSEMPPIMTRIIALGGGVTSVFAGIAGAGLMAAGGLGMVLNQVAQLKKNYPGMIALVGKGTLALKAFGLAAAGMWGPIMVGVAAIILLRETFKAYNEMKDAQEAAEDLGTFSKQIIRSQQNIGKYTRRLEELKKEGTTTGPEVDRLTERIQYNAQNVQKLNAIIGRETPESVSRLITSFRGAGAALDEFGDLAVARLRQTKGEMAAEIQIARRTAQEWKDAAKGKAESALVEAESEKWLRAEIARIRREYGAKSAEERNKRLEEEQTKREELKDRLLEIFGTEEQKAEARINAEIEMLEDLGATHGKILDARIVLEAEYAEKQLEEKRRLKEEERAQWRERAEVIQGFYDEHKRLAESELAFQKEQLDTEYAVYNTYIHDKDALNEWYDAKKKKIIEASTTAEKGSFADVQDVFISGTNTLAGNWLTNMMDMESFSEMSFRRMSDEFGKMIMNMVAKALILKTLELIPGFGGISVGAKLFGAREGAIIGRPEGIPAQEGLMVYGPTRIIAGERGPEMIAPLDRFRDVVREELTASGGGTGGITIIVNANDVQSIADSFRGGALGRALKQVTGEGHQIVNTRGIET